MALRAIRLIIPSGTTAYKSVNIVQKAGVHTSPVRTLKYGWLAYILGERTMPRFSENSKIISVEGNFASGKGALAQKLAEELGMLYMPDPDTFYLDKMMGEKEPLSVDFNGMCSLEKFYTDPKAADGNSYRLQLWMYLMRLLQYSDAIEHLITTGQGVVLERSPFSDIVFAEAMFKEGYIRKQCLDHYNEIRNISVYEFLPPHLTIYVDVHVEEVQRRLKQRGKSYEQNVPLSYLQNIEDGYKKSFLSRIGTVSELLTYDETQALDIEKILEDIEILTFEKGQWKEKKDENYHHMRLLVQDKHKVAHLTQIPKFLPEITIGALDFDQKYFAYRSLPGKKYAQGYNADVGDKYIWLK